MILESADRGIDAMYSPDRESRIIGKNPGNASSAFEMLPEKPA